MTISFNTALNNVPLNTIRDAIDSGTGVGVISIYGTARPASGAAPGASPLVQLSMGAPSFPDSTVLASANNISPGIATAGGTATWFRITNSYGLFILDGSVGSDLVLDSAAIAVDDVVTVTGLSMALGTVLADTNATSEEYVAGLPWSALPQGLNSGANEDIEALATDGAGVWVAGFGSGYASRSVDNGATWSALPRFLNSGGSGTNQIMSIATDEAGVWVAGLSGGWTSRSVDNGVTWSALSRFLNSGGAANIQCLATDRAGVWVHAGSNGYASRSDDNGATWSALPRGLSSGANTSAATFGTATDGAGVWVCTRLTGYASRSTDNGITWSALPQGLNSGGVTTSRAGLSTDRAGVWVSGGISGHCSMSVDNGATWAPLPAYLNSGGTGAASADRIATDEAGVWVAGLAGGWASRSADNGVTWSALSRGLSYIDGAPPATLTIECSALATDRNGVWVAGFGDGYASRSTNNGLDI